MCEIADEKYFLLPAFVVERTLNDWYIRFVIISELDCDRRAGWTWIEVTTPANT